MKITKALGIGFLVGMLIIACQPQANPKQDNPVHRERCGDGECEGPENPVSCPQDCLANVGEKQPEVGIPEDGSAPPSVQQPLFLGLMVHLEGWNDDRDLEQFERHANLVREYAELFEAYGAKLTLESKELTDGSIRWGDNVLLEMEGRGHGIGVHADIGGSRDYDCDQFAADLRAERLQLESLGVQVQHLSGNTSHCDWVAASIEAGYEFTTGTVAYNVMSMPEDLRPAAYRDCPTPSKCHEIFPPDMEDRLHPWRAATGKDWLTHDPRGGLVILASDGGLNCLQEELELGETAGCEFNAKDIDFAVDQIEKALELSDPGKINFIYFSWSLGKALDQGLMEMWLQAFQPYIEDGRVVWATLPQVYDAFIGWEQAH